MPGYCFWKEALLCLANYITPKCMSVQEHVRRQLARDTHIKPVHVLPIFRGKLQSLPRCDMAGSSKAATHSVSPPKGTPHRGQSADVITTLLCRGTVRSLCSFSSLLQMYRANLQAMPLPADHQRYNRVPQRGLEHPAEDGVQRPPHLPGHSPQGDHPGGRRQCGW